MEYNPFTDIREGNFSLRRDYEMTLKHIDTLLIDNPSRFLGNLSRKKDVIDVREMYLIGGALALAGIVSSLSGEYSSAKLAGVCSLASLVIAPLHHYAMASRNNNRITHNTFQ
ncbi:MAG: hypothetical protein AABW82_01870 [Nanoarchaeota archaeon]